MRTGHFGQKIAFSQNTNQASFRLSHEESPDAFARHERHRAAQVGGIGHCNRPTWAEYRYGIGHQTAFHCVDRCGAIQRREIELTSKARFGAHQVRVSAGGADHPCSILLGIPVPGKGREPAKLFYDGTPRQQPFAPFRNGSCDAAELQLARYNSEMKYVIVIPDGCADEPLAELGNRTPLQAAAIPNMDRVVQTGIIGLSNNVPASLTPASDVATLSLFGYDPLVVYTGRAPLETAAMGIPLGPNDWAIRCNLVHFPNGMMENFTSGHITSEEGRQLVEALQKELGGRELGGGVIEFHAGVSYRNILVWRGHSAASPLAGMKTQPPHDVQGQPIEQHLPTGPGREIFIELMTASQRIFADHPVNRARVAAGKLPATQCWLWGQGKAPTVRPFLETYGKRGAIISAVDLVRGVGALLGWQRINVPGATGYLDTNYANKGKYAVQALPDYDVVCVHVEAPDEASHEGQATEKVRALEQIDTHIVGPLLRALPAYGDYRILIEPDHRTTIRTKAHAYGAVPFAVAGTGLRAAGQTQYDEPTATLGRTHFDPGWQLMNWFLNKTLDGEPAQ
jgi:2,3-bisphosphoglycerate-independent phosphoglycerate mutase